MKLSFKMFPLLCMYLLLISATSIKTSPASLVNMQNNTIAQPENTTVVKVHKLNFFQRLLLKFIIKKNKKEAGVRADQLASTSLLLGVAACVLLVLGLLIPYVIVAAVPASIAAMITGGSALRNKTSLVGKAKTGKALGLGALIAFGVLLIAAVILVSSFY
ncbi:MAG: hypothetical protein ABI285_04965 [Ginsengibacter sp.]